MNSGVAIHKLSAEQRMAAFDPGKVNALVRDSLSGAGIFEEAVRIVPFTILSAQRLAGMVRAISKIGEIAGDTAEIGCNAGGTSRLIALLNRGRRHWACDTFVGLVDVDEQDGGGLQNGDFSNRLCKADLVAQRLSDLNVQVVSGYFPDDAPSDMLSARYAFVHIDVDTYRSIHACFAFFIGRMSRGGIMVLDDVIGRGTAGGKAAWAEILAADGGRFTLVEQNDPHVIIRVN